MQQAEVGSQIGLSEVVLRTPRYESLCAYYAEVLQQPPSVEMQPESAVGTTDPDVPTRIAFFNLRSAYPYTQRIAIFECADEGGSDRRAVGLHHLQVRLPGLPALFASYERLKSAGHRPVESQNHVIATSLYYLDLDGNRLELSALNFATEQEVKDYMGSEAFKRNPEGAPFDPEDFLQRHLAGTSFDEMVRLG